MSGRRDVTMTSSPTGSEVSYEELEIKYSEIDSLETPEASSAWGQVINGDTDEASIVPESIEVVKVSESSWCRICATYSSTLLSIFGEVGVREGLVTKIHRYLPITVTEEDVLPTQMCRECIRKLNDCHDFINLCAEADTRLRDFFKIHTDDDRDDNDGDDDDSDYDNTREDNYRETSRNYDNLIRDMKERQKEQDAQVREVLQRNSDSQTSGTTNSKEAGLSTSSSKQTTLPSQETLDIRNSTYSLKWPCNTCGQIFSTERSLEKHQHDHPLSKEVCQLVSTQEHTTAGGDQTSNECDVCAKEIGSKNRLCVHKSNPSDVKTCRSYMGNLKDIKESTVVKKRTVVRHGVSKLIKETSSRGSVVYICGVCKRRFRKRKIAIIHMRVHADSQQYSCDICFKQFRSRVGMKDHVLTHTNEYNYKCNTCGKQFKRASQLSAHKKTHLREKFTCKLCNVTILSRGGAFNHHLNSHTLEERKKIFECAEDRAFLTNRRFVCDLCVKLFSRKASLAVHMRLDHGNTDDDLQTMDCDAETTFQCDLCKKFYSSKYALEMHNKRHQGLMRTMCEICGKNFVEKVALKLHIRRHFEQPSYSCEICDKKFITDMAVKKHVKVVHCSERPYDCITPGCDRRFKSICDRNVHQKEVHEAPHFPCKLCPQTFREERKLAAHIDRRHATECPFECDICHQSFPSVPSLNRHRVRHNQQFVCEICGKYYIDRKSLKRHTVFSHNIIKNTVTTPVTV